MPFAHISFNHADDSHVVMSHITHTRGVEKSGTIRGKMTNIARSSLEWDCGIYINIYRGDCGGVINVGGHMIYIYI